MTAWLRWWSHRIGYWIRAYDWAGVLLGLALFGFLALMVLIIG